jgi:AraC family transcriptional regulator
MKEKTERAAELLRETTKSVTDISEMLGFAGASHMARLFKQYYGQTPGEYRQSRA